MPSNRLIFYFEYMYMSFALYRYINISFDFFDMTWRRNQINVSFTRLFSIKTFSIRWFDTYKDFSLEELIRQIISYNFFRKPNSPPNEGFVLCLHRFWTIIGKLNWSFWREWVWWLIGPWFVCSTWGVFISKNFVLFVKFTSNRFKCVS